MLELAPRRCECAVLAAVDVLIAKHEHLPLEQGTAELRHQLVVEVATETNTAHLSADDRSQGFDSEALVRAGVEAGADPIGCQGARRRQRISRGGREDRHQRLLGVQVDRPPCAG